MKNLNFDAHFKDLFENTNDLIQFVDIEGTILKTNPAWLKNLEYEANEVIARSAYDFISADSYQIYKTYRDQVIYGKSRANIEFQFISKYGAPIIVEGHIGCFYEDDLPVYTRGVFRNITAKREAEILLKKNQSRLNAFISNAPSAVIIIDQNQTVLEWNPKAQDIFGFMYSEVLGQPLADIIIPHQYREAHARGMAHFLNTGEGPVLNRTIEVSALHKNGKEFPVSLSISGVQIDGSWLFIAFISDITEEKRLQQEIIHNEAALLQAKKEEEKKDQFLSMASHELKTPLTSLKAYLQLLERRNMSDTAFPLLGKASSYVRKLEILISDLLDVSKIKEDRIEYKIEKFSFRKFLKESIEGVQLFTDSHQIIIEHCDDAICSGDINRLDQVIHNLLTNAIKYSPAADKIIVNARIHDHHMLTSIRDFGIGIASENQTQIFHRFYRVDNADMKFQGLGIGLFISKEIVERSGGQLWVQSKPGEGSLFSFSLPIE